MSENTLIGNYRLIRRLGQGGMSNVWLAEDTSGQQVALKMLRTDLSGDAKARARLSREAAAINRVNSHYVADVLDLETEGQDAFIVTEYIDGETLAEDVTSHGPWSPADLSELADKLAEALRDLHAAGVLHRDLKPGNLMLSDRGPVLIDFGIAQLIDGERLTDTGLVTGTPGYLAPEVLRGDDPSEASDWWALAAVLLFCATGHPPFGGGPLQAVLARVESGQCQCVGADPQVAGVLTRALQPDPHRRPAPKEWLSDLAKIASGGDDPHQAATTWLAPESENSPSTTVMGTETSEAEDSERFETADSGVNETFGTAETTDVDESSDADESAYEALASADFDTDVVDQIPNSQRPASPDGRGWQPLDPRDTFIMPLSPAAPLTALVLAVVFAVVSTYSPLALALVWAVFVVVTHTIGLGRYDLHFRVHKRPGSRFDLTKTILKTPWFLVKALLSQALSSAIGLGVGLLIFWIVTSPVMGMSLREVLPETPFGGIAGAGFTGDGLRNSTVLTGNGMGLLGLSPSSTIQLAFAISVLVAIIVAWSMPFSLRARDGARTVWRAVLPKRWLRMVAFIILLLVAALAVWILVPVF